MWWWARNGNLNMQWGTREFPLTLGLKWSSDAEASGCFQRMESLPRQIFVHHWRKLKQPPYDVGTVSRYKSILGRILNRNTILRETATTINSSFKMLHRDKIIISVLLTKIVLQVLEICCPLKRPEESSLSLLWVLTVLDFDPFRHSLPKLKFKRLT